MIYTITLNSAIDHVLKFQEFKINQTNRAIKDYQYAAGKGIHVSKMLTNMQVNNLAIYLSGKNDDWFEKDLKNQNINYLRVNVDEGKIRENLKLIDHNFQTECNGLGIIAKPKHLDQIANYLRQNLKPNDLIIISGSLPQGITQEAFLNFLAKIKREKVEFIFDLSDINILLKTLQFKPLLIKPNETEMMKINNNNLQANDLLKMGAQNVFFSQAEKGGTLFESNQTSNFKLTKTFKVDNSAGSGDALIGGFASKFVKKCPIREAIKFGLICGTATAISKGIASKERVTLVRKELKW